MPCREQLDHELQVLHPAEPLGQQVAVDLVDAAGELEDEIAQLVRAAGAVVGVKHPLDGPLDAVRQALFERRGGGPQLVNVVLGPGQQRAQVGHRWQPSSGVAATAGDVRRLGTARPCSQILDPAVELRSASAIGFGSPPRGDSMRRPDALLPSIVYPF